MVHQFENRSSVLLGIQKRKVREEQEELGRISPNRLDVS